VLQRKMRGRVQFTNSDRLFFVLLYRLFPSVLKAMAIVRPEAVVRWHRAGCRAYWRWKSRNPEGRPRIAAELRALIWKRALRVRIDEKTTAPEAVGKGGERRCQGTLACAAPSAKRQ
jgi:hypothetical protein